MNAECAEHFAEVHCLLVSQQDSRLLATDTKACQQITKLLAAAELNHIPGYCLYTLSYRGVPHVAFGREYVQPIETANIPAGGCILHVIGQTVSH